MKTGMLLLVLLMASATWANERGNGGDAVVCRNAQGKITRAELFDYYEGRTLRNFPTVTSRLSDVDFYKSLAQRLYDFDEQTFADVREEALKLSTAITAYLKGQRIQPGVAFTKDVLTDIPDTDAISLPRNCEIEQLAVRLKRQFPEDPEYLIQGDILKKLSARDVRGLVIHELIYRGFTENLAAKNSVSARYLHQKIMAKPLEKMNFADYMLVRSLMPGQELICKQLCFFGTDYDVLDDGSFLLRSQNLRFVADKTGLLNLEKTLKFGRINALPGFIWSGFYHVDWVMRSNGLEYRLDPEAIYPLFPFGRWDITMDITPMGEEAQAPIEIGAFISDNGQFFGHSTIEAPTAPVQVNYGFDVTLDKSFQLVVKKIEAND
jgi:hypothetical protein